jgi:hypothetical protein
MTWLHKVGDSTENVGMQDIGRKQACSDEIGALAKRRRWLA